MRPIYALGVCRFAIVYRTIVEPDRTHLIACRSGYGQPSRSYALPHGPPMPFALRAHAGIVDAHGRSMLVNEHGIPIALPGMDGGESDMTSQSGTRAAHTVRSSAISKDLAACTLTSSSGGSSAQVDDTASSEYSSSAGSWHSAE